MAAADMHSIPTWLTVQHGWPLAALTGFVCLLAAPEGVERLRAMHPDVAIWAAAIDEGLDENAFIVPGLGDAGDRTYGTR